MSRIISAKKAIKILSQDFGFSFISQKGSHIKLRKKIKNRTIVTIIPLHKELAPGTLKGVLRLAQVNEKEFWEKEK